MKDVVEQLKDVFDFEKNLYFCHETSYGRAEKACEEGFLLSGNNILDVENLLFTTTTPLSKELADDEEKFTTFLEGELNLNPIRPITEMVILGIPKDKISDAVEPYYGDSSIDTENGTNYIVSPDYVLGYINLKDQELILNESYNYDNDFYSY